MAHSSATTSVDASDQADFQYDVFVSHDWETPATNAQVTAICAALRDLPLRCWLRTDHSEQSDMLAAVQRAVDTSRLFLAFVTANYEMRVQTWTDVPGHRSACQQELEHAISENKPILVVVLDAELARSDRPWQGPLAHMQRQPRIDCSSATPAAAARLIVESVLELLHDINAPQVSSPYLTPATSPSAIPGTPQEHGAEQVTQMALEEATHKKAATTTSLAMQMDQPTTDGDDFAFDLFLSHDWKTPGNHRRVSEICTALRALHLRCWFDDDETKGDIPVRIASGIKRSQFFIAFVTAEYGTKLAQEQGTNWCQQEFGHAYRKRGVDNMLAVVLDPSMLGTESWDGILGLHLGSRLYLDCTTAPSPAAIARKIFDHFQTMPSAASVPVPRAPSGGPFRMRTAEGVAVRGGPGQVSPSFERGSARVLFVTPAVRADLPGGIEQQNFGSDSERRALANVLAMNDLIIAVGVHYSQLVDLLASHRPRVLHISAHLSETSTDGLFPNISNVELAQGIRGLGVELLVLNACCTDKLTGVLLSIVPTIVATTAVINVHAAVAFSRFFYESLANHIHDDVLPCAAALQHAKDRMRQDGLCQGHAEHYVCHGGPDHRPAPSAQQRHVPQAVSPAPHAVAHKEQEVQFFEFHNSVLSLTDARTRQDTRTEYQQVLRHINSDGFCFVHAPSGMGKTVLASYVADQLHAGMEHGAAAVASAQPQPPAFRVLHVTVHGGMRDRAPATEDTVQVDRWKQFARGLLDFENQYRDPNHLVVFRTEEDVFHFLADNFQFLVLDDLHHVLDNDHFLKQLIRLKKSLNVERKCKLLALSQRDVGLGYHSGFDPRIELRGLSKDEACALYQKLHSDKAMDVELSTKIGHVRDYVSGLASLLWKAFYSPELFEVYSSQPQHVLAYEEKIRGALRLAFSKLEPAQQRLLEHLCLLRVPTSSLILDLLLKDSNTTIMSASTLKASHWLHGIPIPMSTGRHPLLREGMTLELVHMKDLERDFLLTDPLAEAANERIRHLKLGEIYERAVRPDPRIYRGFDKLEAKAFPFFPDEVQERVEGTLVCMSEGVPGMTNFDALLQTIYHQLQSSEQRAVLQASKYLLIVERLLYRYERQDEAANLVHVLKDKLQDDPKFVHAQYRIREVRMATDKKKFRDASAKLAELQATEKELIQESFYGEKVALLIQAILSERSSAIHHAQGDYQKAAQGFNSCVRLFQDAGNPKGLSSAYRFLADSERAAGLLSEAAEHYDDARRILFEKGLKGTFFFWHNLNAVSGCFQQLRDDRGRAYVLRAIDCREAYINSSFLSDDPGLMALCKKTNDIARDLFTNCTLGVIFDCDGVIVDSELNKEAAWRDVLAALAPSARESFNYATVVGQSSAVIWQHIRDANPGLDWSDPKLSQEAMLQSWSQCYEDAKRQSGGNRPILPVARLVRGVLAAKKAWFSNLRVAVASSDSRDSIISNLQAAGIDKLEELVIVSGHDVTAQKPAPEIYTHAAGKLGLEPARCIALEDTCPGVESAVSARIGMVLGISHRLTTQESLRTVGAHGVLSREHLENMSTSDLLARALDIDLTVVPHHPPPGESSSSW